MATGVSSGGGFALVSVAAGVLVAALPGCEVLSGIELPAATETCSLDSDCPATQWCVGLVCRDACDDGRCAAGATCGASEGHRVCLGPAPDAGEGVADAGGGPVMDSTGAPDAGGEGASSPPDCSSCDPTSAVCIEDICRVLSWSTPQTENAEPVPAPDNSRYYAQVPRNVLYGQHISIPQPGFVVRLGLLASTAPAQAGALIGVSLYSDAQHFPVVPLAQPPLQPSTADADDSGRQEFPVDPPLHVAAGDYWLVFYAQTRVYNLQGTGASLETAEAPVASDAGPWLNPFPPNANPPLVMADRAIIVYAAVAMDP